MTRGLPSAGGICAAWAAMVRRRAWAVAVLAVIAVGLSGLYLARNLAINTDTTDMLSADLPFRKHQSEIKHLFPQDSDTILLVLDGAVPEQVDRAAADLADRLRQKPQLFGPLYDPAGDPFLRRNGLLFLDTGELETLTRRLAEAQPFLASLWAEASLANLFNLLRQGLDGSGGQPPAAFGRVLDDLAAVAEARATGAPAVLSWQRLLAGGGAEPAQRLMVLKPPADFTTLHPGAKPIAALKDLRKELGLGGTGPVRMRISGSLALQQDELISVEQGMGLAGLLSFVLVIGLLVLAFRSLRLVIAVLATLIAGLIWTAAFAIWAIGALNLISVAFAVLFIGLSVDFGIHYVLRYRERVDGGQDNAAAIDAAAGAGGGGLALCALAAAISFYAFLPTDYVGLAELGVIAGTGMFIALAANLTLLPALLALMPARPRPPSPDGTAGTAGWSRRWIEGNPRLVLAGAAVLLAAGVALLPQARFDFDPLNLQDRGLESVAVIHELADDPETTPYGATVLAQDLAAAREVSRHLKALPEVAGVSSILSFLPDNQAEKAEIIQDLSLFLLPSLSAGGGKGATGTDNAKAAADLLAALDKAAAGSDHANAAARFARALRAVGDNAGGDRGLAGLEAAYLTYFPDAVAQLRTALAAAPFALEDLPADIRARNVAADGRVRIAIHPKADLRDRAALDRFVAAVRGLAPAAAGTPFIIVEAGRAVSNAFLEAGAIAVVAILFLLGVVLRRAVDVALVFAPLALAAVLTAAVSALAGLAFNFANIIVLPLLFGLGVASGIHLVLRDRQERRAHHRPAGDDAVDPAGGAFATSTPRAVWYSALTTIGSFGAIALSGHPGTASMGVLLTVAITLTLACTLVLLPALLVLRAGGKGAL